jgi:hypothetical protein
MKSPCVMPQPGEVWERFPSSPRIVKEIVCVQDGTPVMVRFEIPGWGTRVSTLESFGNWAKQAKRVRRDPPPPLGQ